MKRKVPVLFIGVGLFRGLLWGGEVPAKPWKNVGEVSVVSTNGNSKATSTSAKDTFNYSWTRTVLELVGGALGSSNGDTVTAEQYTASEKLSYMLTADKKNYLFEKGLWDRNRFAGFSGRWDGSGGYGRELLGISSHTLIGEIGAGYINEDRIDAPRNEFFSTRVYTKYTYVFSPTASFRQDAEYIHNDKNSRDYRANTETALITTISTHFSLKVSYVWHRVGEPPAGIGKDDTITSAALLVNY